MTLNSNQLFYPCMLIELNTILNTGDVLVVMCFYHYEGDM